MQAGRKDRRKTADTHGHEFYLIDRPQGSSESPRADRRRKKSQKLEIQINVQFGLILEGQLAELAESCRIVNEPKLKEIGLF